MAGLEENLDVIQGNILGGFNKDHQTMLFLRVVGAEKAKLALLAIVNEIATAREVRDFGQLFKAVMSRRGGEHGELKATWMNIAFTFGGLQALGFDEIDQFPEAYQQGMKARAAIIGDVGASDPTNWLTPLGDQSRIHVVVIVAADTPQDVEKAVTRYLTTLVEGFDLVFTQVGTVRVDQPGHEHFGFRDGVSQPGVRHFDAHIEGGNALQGNPGQDRLQPGEFLLGYPTQLPFAKTDCVGKKPMEPNPDEGPISPKHGGGDETAPSWGTNGSYMVFRRLRQNVPGFKKFVADLATKLNLSVDLMGAKLVGRYASGAPLERTKTLPNVDTTTIDPSIAHPELLGAKEGNNFEFGDDPDGEIVPRAAHIRKAYPRDEPTRDGDKSKDFQNSESTTQTHRMLRRGIPYGVSFRPPADTIEDDNIDRGLLFVAYQSSIARQFEFVQSKWVNDPSFPNLKVLAKDEKGKVLDDGQDPIMAQDTPAAPFTMPVSGKAAHQFMMQHFVTTTGGDYFFQPSIAAIFNLSGGGVNEPSKPKPKPKPDAEPDNDIDFPGADPCQFADPLDPPPAKKA